MADFIPQAPEGNLAPPPPKAPRTAVASLVLGLLSFIFSIFTGIVAVICGHKALGKIKRSGGLMPGKGMAITGLVTGYLSIAGLFLVVPVIAGLAVPIFAKVQENGQMTMVINDARQGYYAVQQYKNDNDGDYPVSLQELVETSGLPPETITASSYPGLTYDGGAPEGQLFHYIQPDQDAAPDTVFLISDCSFSSSDAQVRRIVAKLDGSVMSQRFPRGEPVR